MKKDKSNSKQDNKEEIDDSLWGYIKRFWYYLWHDDSLLSYVLNFVFAFLFIKYLLFPGLGFVLNNDYPVVAIVSGSMEHKIVDHRVCDKNIVDVTTQNLIFDEWWQLCGSYYEKNFNLTDNDFQKFSYRNGLNIGDVMVLYGKDSSKVQIGDILVFVPGDQNWFDTHGPVIHRVVKKWQDENGKYHFQTKGDHNEMSISYGNFENDISEDNVIGIAVFRVPFIGYAKIWLMNMLYWVVGGFSNG